MSYISRESSRNRVLSFIWVRNACSSRNDAYQQLVAIRRFSEPFVTANLARYIFREIKLLRSLKHTNVANLVDISVSPSGEVYIVTELMETDLQTLLRTRPVHGEFSQYFLYQIMRGLKYIHSAGIVHCDLKPSNILVNRNCDLKINNIAHLRSAEPSTGGYVSALYYRAPEAILKWQSCDEFMDIWSAGCILAELLRGKILFGGQNSIHQLHNITKLLGTPSEIAINRMTGRDTSDTIRLLPKSQGHPLSDIITDVDPEAIYLLEKLLVFDPQGRVSASEALAFAYLAPYHDPADEPEAERKFNWTLGRGNDTVEVWKTRLHAEVLDHRGQAESQQNVQRWLLDVTQKSPAVSGQHGAGQLRSQSKEVSNQGALYVI